MYFLFFKLHCQSKRSAAQPQTICSEVPLLHGSGYAMIYKTQEARYEKNVY